MLIIKVIVYFNLIITNNNDSLNIGHWPFLFSHLP